MKQIAISVMTNPQVIGFITTTGKAALTTGLAVITDVALNAIGKSIYNKIQEKRGTNV